MKKLTYEIVIEREEDPKAGYSVYCPDLPGCFSNGGSVAEAKKNMREAIELFLESLIAHGDPIPRPRHAIQIETVDLAVPA
ncbi:MAG TPA: type II toxin-antitoxin system HicB family antitoxin [Verrucomicrobiae bacterium]